MSEPSKKIILTEKLVNKVFHSGLRLSITSSNTNPHKEALLKLVPEETPRNIKKELYTEKIVEKLKKKEENDKKNLNRFNNEKNTNKVKTDIFFKENKKNSNLTLSQEEQGTTVKKEKISKKAIGEFVKKDCSVLYFNHQDKIETEIEKKRILVPSKSQIIKINHLIGSNPVNLLGKKEMNAYEKANQIDKNKQVASSNIRSSVGMKGVLQSENEENGSSIKKSQALNEKVNYFSSSILMGLSKEVDKKREIKTFRHVYDRNMKVTGYRD